MRGKKPKLPTIVWGVACKKAYLDENGNLCMEEIADEAIIRDGGLVVDLAFLIEQGGLREEYFEIKFSVGDEKRGVRGVAAKGITKFGENKKAYITLSAREGKFAKGITRLLGLQETLEKLEQGLITLYLRGGVKKTLTLALTYEK